MRSEEYEEVIRAIVEEERSVVGGLALSRAASVDGIAVEDGQLTFTEEMREHHVVALVDQFRSFQGDGAKGIAKRAVERTRIEPSFLPGEILPPSSERGIWIVGSALVGIMMAMALFNARQDLFALHGNFIAGLIGAGPQALMDMNTPAFYFSLVAAFVIGVGHDFIPCSIPVWSTLLTTRTEEETTLTRFGLRSVRYFIGSALVLASFGVVLGYFGASLRPLVASFNELMIRNLIGATVFGAVGIISIAWGLSKFNMVALPSFDLHDRVHGLAENNRVLHSDLIDGMVFGGSEVACPFPTYHLLLLWIVLIGDPLYGGLLLTTFTLGKTLPIVVIGFLLRANSRRVFQRFRLGHGIFDTINGAVLITLGSMLVFVLMQMLLLGPTGSSPTLIFALVQAVIGAGIAYGAIAIYNWTNPLGWRFLAFTGVAIAAWSMLAPLTYSTTMAEMIALPAPHAIEGVMVPIVAALISLTVVLFVDRDLPVDAPAWFTTRTVTAYLLVVLAATVFGAMARYDLTPALFTVTYHASAVLMLPALYGLHRIHRMSKLRTWTYFYLATALALLAVVASFYGSMVCGAGGPGGEQLCADYGYTFASLIDVPVIDRLVQAAFVAPLLMLLAVASFGQGTLIFYHRMYQPVKKAVSIEGNRMEQLLRGAVDVLEPMVGRGVAEEMVLEAVADMDDVKLSFRGDEPIVTLGVSIDSEETFQELVDALLAECSASIGEAASDEIRTVAEEVRQLAAETGRQPATAPAAADEGADLDGLVQDHTVAEVKERVRDEGLDPRKVLEAEHRNDDRVTLTRWLEDRLEDETDA